MATTIEDTTKKDNFTERTGREITPSEKQQQIIKERGRINSRRQKLALWLGGAQIISFISLCIPLHLHKMLTYCDTPIAMKVVYAVIALAILVHVLLIFTSIRKTQPGGLWVPMAVQASVTSIAAVQLFLMIKLYAKAGTDMKTQFEEEMCQTKVEKAKLHENTQRQLYCAVGASLCLLAFAMGIAGFITNFLLFFELRKYEQEEDNRQNREILERQQNRIAVLHSMIRLHEMRKEAENANEGIKTAKEPVEGAAQNPDDQGPPSLATKSKHRMI